MSKQKKLYEFKGARFCGKSIDHKRQRELVRKLSVCLMMRQNLSPTILIEVTSNSMRYLL